MSAGLLPPEGSLLSLPTATFSLGPHMAFLWVLLAWYLPLLVRAPVLSDQGPTLRTSFLTLTTSLRALSPNIFTLGVKASTYRFCVDRIQSLTERKQPLSLTVPMGQEPGHRLVGPLAQAVSQPAAKMSPRSAVIANSTERREVSSKHTQVVSSLLRVPLWLLA